MECIDANKVPKQWLNISYPTEKTFSSYLNDFCERFAWIQNWWISKEMPKTFWLPAFFHPRRFIEAIQLDFARKYELPLEEITIDCAVVHDSE